MAMAIRRTGQQMEPMFHVPCPPNPIGAIGFIGGLRGMGLA
jgi:hypothetical protein